LQAVTPEIAETLALKRPAGALVAAVTANSPAAKSGLRTGDLIVGIDGQPVDDPNAFDYRFATKQLGGLAQVKVMRGGKEVPVAIALETAPDGPRDEMIIRATSPFQGAKVANLSPALAEELRLNATTQGVVVIDVTVGSAAHRLGFQRGDLINTVNSEKIGKTRDLERVAAQASRVWRLTFTRGGRQHSVTLGG
jgi:S1-C subfamily serine protease